MSRPNVILAGVVFVAAVAGGCKKAADMAKYKERAQTLAAKYAPKLAELGKRLPDLAAHAKDIPSSVPGADRLQKLLADNKKELDQAQELLAKLPAQIGTDTPDQADQQLDAADKLLASEVVLAEQDELDEADIEKRADAAKSVGSSEAGSNQPVPPTATK